MAGLLEKAVMIVATHGSRSRTNITMRFNRRLHSEIAEAFARRFACYVNLH